MAETQKELAFLRDLYIQDDWTRRFADLVDKHLDLSDSENLAYLNAGSGGHAMDISDRLGDKLDVFASVENDDLLRIASEKSAAVSSRVDLSAITFEGDSFDAVISDASLVTPGEVTSAIDEAVRIARSGADVGVFIPTSGSFGEIFSVMWEIIAMSDDPNMIGLAERLIADLPTTSAVEAAGQAAGLVNIRTDTSVEAFEFENGDAFATSPLVRHFLLPLWFDDKDEIELDAIAANIGRLIDEEAEDLSFRFTVKATLLSGEKG
jgi:hypothetical protein